MTGAPRPDLRFLVRHPAHFIALGFGAGLSPVAPGTFGTLVAVPIAWALFATGSDALYIAAVAALLGAGAWASQVTGRNLGVADAGAIVVDEIAAFLLVLFFAGSDTWRELIAFLLFRLFDIVKPPPIGYIDRAVKNGVGVMLDDLLAAGYTLLVLAVAQRFLGVNMRAAVDLRRIEEQSLNVTQSGRQLFYDGWLLRLLPGRIKRARSVNAFYPSSLDLAQKIRHCEQVYADAGLPAIWRITPFDQPPALDAALAQRGYARYEQTHVLVAVVAVPPEVAHRDGVEISALSATDYCTAVAAIRGSTDEQRAAHEARLAQSATGRYCVVAKCDGRPVASAQLAFEGDIAGLFDIVTAVDAQRRGHATALCAHMLNWGWGRGMRAAYLQVTATNAAAMAVYRKFGFEPGYTYHYRGRPGEFA